MFARHGEEPHTLILQYRVTSSGSCGPLPKLKSVVEPLAEPEWAHGGASAFNAENPRGAKVSVESNPDGAMTCMRRGSADSGFHVYQMRLPCGIYVSNADVALAWDIAMSGDPM